MIVIISVAYIAFVLLLGRFAGFNQTDLDQ